MAKNNQRFKDPATARKYIRNVSNQFAEPEQMLEFLQACDTAQAALADWLFNEHRYYCIQKSLYVRGSHTELESQLEIRVAWNKYLQASEEFFLAKCTLKNIIAQLNVDSILTEMENN